MKKDNVNEIFDIIEKGQARNALSIPYLALLRLQPYGKYLTKERIDKEIDRRNLHTNIVYIFIGVVEFIFLGMLTYLIIIK